MGYCYCCPLSICLPYIDGVSAGLRQGRFHSKLIGREHPEHTHTETAVFSYIPPSDDQHTRRHTHKGTQDMYFRNHTPTR